jgi:mono/diheme cytochrome c family protein
MRQSWIFVLVPAGLMALIGAAAAQTRTPDSALNDRQKLGRSLYTQSCLVCHTRPQITAGLYGPPLSRDSAGGQAEVMRAFISEGTPRMPAFKHHFTTGEIDAIVQYLKTVPKPGTPAGTGAKGDSPVD